MKHFILIFTSLISAAAFSLAGELVNADANAKAALQAYDPVGFFTDHKPVKGNPTITVEHAGYTYYFASEEHKADFLKDPDKYLPAYGGYCAYGVSIGKLFPVEIDTWEIVNGRLVLQYSKDVKALFKRDSNKNFQEADANWPKLQVGN
jgi:YHS domain-containing protein